VNIFLSRSGRTRVLFDAMVFCDASINHIKNNNYEPTNKLKRNRHKLIISKWLKSKHYFEVLRKRGENPLRCIDRFLDHLGRYAEHHIGGSNISRTSVSSRILRGLRASDQRVVRTAVAAKRRNIDVFIITRDSIISDRDRILNNEHEIRVLSPPYYSNYFC